MRVDRVILLKPSNITLSLYQLSTFNTLNLSKDCIQDFNGDVFFASLEFLVGVFIQKMNRVCICFKAGVFVVEGIGDDEISVFLFELISRIFDQVSVSMAKPISTCPSFLSSPSQDKISWVCFNSIVLSALSFFTLFL